MAESRHISLCHWGAFVATVKDCRLMRTAPLPGSGADPAMIGAWPELVYSPLRIRQPMVRRSFLEKGPHSDRRGRGREPFVPVAWNTALDLVAAELRRVRENYGAEAIFGGSYGWSSAGCIHHARSLVRRFLSASGGHVDQLGNYSWGAAQFILPHVLGNYDAVARAETAWPSIAAHTDLMVAFGGLNPKNWNVTSGGAGSHAVPEWLRKAHARGMRTVVISPFRGDAPKWLGAEWIAPRPGSDTAIMLALAHEVIRLGAHDTAFLDRYCHGFDAFHAYLAGQADGVQKDCDWAAAIADVPAIVLRDLARAMANGRTMLTATWSLQRADRGEQPFWALIALAAVLGQIGLPGGGFSFGYGSMNGVGAVRRRGLIPRMDPIPNPARRAIPVARIADMLLHPGEAFDFNGKTMIYPDIRLVYWAGGNPFHHHQDLHRLREAWTRPETIVVHDPWWTPVAKHADIVLPATTTAEREDIGGSSRDPFVFHMPKLIEPVGEARDDFAIFAELAERLGCRDVFTGGRDVSGWVRHLFDRMLDAARAQQLSPPDFETFVRSGYWRVPNPDADDILLEIFRRDPADHPLATPSGRIEIFSETIAAFGYDDCPPHPAWRAPIEWLGADAAERFPLHLITHQPGRQLHSQLGQTSVGRRDDVGGFAPVLIHPADAADRKIGNGDVVRVFNDRGTCLAGAVVTSEVRAGVAIMSTGGWFDRVNGGSPNVLTPDRGTSRLAQGPSPMSTLVDIRRESGVPAVGDGYRPPHIEESHG